MKRGLDQELEEDIQFLNDVIASFVQFAVVQERQYDADEAAIKKLPQLATTGRGQGIQLLTIWHDEAQLQHRYGHRASTVLNGHRAKLLLSGQADPASLELASKLVGDEAVTQTSETTGGDGRASLTESTAYRSRR